jgi:hypothetical protein
MPFLTCDDVVFTITINNCILTRLFYNEKEFSLRLTDRYFTSWQISLPVTYLLFTYDVFYLKRKAVLDFKLSPCNAC